MVMSRIVMIVLLIGGLSACHAGFGIGDNGRGDSTGVASNALGSAVAQSSIGGMDTVASAAY
jgi:hypothetical protein